MKKRKHHDIWKILLYLYLIFLFLVVAVKFNGNLQSIVNRWGIIVESRKTGEMNLNLVPFDTIRPYLKHFSQKYAYTNIIGNLFLFVPAGFLFPMVMYGDHIFAKTMLLCFIMVVGIELFQLITCLGFCDIDDVILNMIGCLGGYGCLIVATKKKWVEW